MMKPPLSSETMKANTALTQLTSLRSEVDR
jgi:hypothetical protein